MKRSLISCALVLALCHTTVSAQQDAAAAIASLVDNQTVVAARVDLTKVRLTTLAKSLIGDNALEGDDFFKNAAKADAILEKLLGAGVREIYGLLSVSHIPREPFLLAIPMKGLTPRRIESVTNLLKKTLRAPEVRHVRGFIVAGPKHVVDHVAEAKPQANAQLAKAFAAVKNYDVQLVLVMPQGPLRKSLLETMPQLPPPLGGDKTAPLVNGFRFAAAGVKLKPKVTAFATVQAANPAMAKKYRELLMRGMGLARKENRDKELGLILDRLRELLTPKLVKDRLVLNLKMNEIVAFLRPAVLKVRSAAKRMQSQNNLRQMALALHNYHDVYGKFPAAANRDKNGKKLLSWRVHILPFIEQENLYKQFKLNEPWDSPHNKKLIAKIPETYRSPNSKAGPNKTTYLAPMIDGAVLGKRPVKIQQIRDGTSQTVMILETNDKEAVIWTKPQDYKVDPNNPARGLGNNPQKVFHAAFADGSVHSILRTVKTATLRHLFQMADGNVVGDF